MALYCELCGTRTDGVERLGVYCPGEYCGTDLRAGADAGVRAWCEPERRFGVAGGTVLVDLLVCNSGPRATGFHLEPVEPVRGRLDFDRRAAGAPLASGATRRIELRYTVPLDLVGPALDIASRFGVPAADVVGRAQGALPSRFGGRDLGPPGGGLRGLATDPAAGTVVSLDAPVTLWFAIRPVVR